MFKFKLLFILLFSTSLFAAGPKIKIGLIEKTGLDKNSVLTYEFYALENVSHKQEIYLRLKNNIKIRIKPSVSGDPYTIGPTTDFQLSGNISEEEGRNLIIFKGDKYKLRLNEKKEYRFVTQTGQVIELTLQVII